VQFFWGGLDETSACLLSFLHITEHRRSLSAVEVTLELMKKPCVLFPILGVAEF
jgi:hypothetical protein